MKDTLEVDINIPITQVVPLVDSIENMNKWMEELQHFEAIGGG